MAKPAPTVISRHVRQIRKSLSTAERALRRLAPLVRAAARAEAPSSARPARKLRLSPRRLAALKLQGTYMGYLRGLRPREKNRVKALREKHGLRAAILLAKRLGKG